MNPILAATPLSYTRSPRYWAKDYLYPCPCTPVFRAKVSAIPTGSSYLTLSYDTVSLGVYTDIQIGQTVIISATSDHTNYLNIGRVAAAPTSTLIPVNEDKYPLLTTYYITVVDEYRELPRVRAGNLIDGRLAYQNLPPAIKNMRSAYLKWSSTTASFSFAPTGRAMAYGATIASYAWYIPGATYTSGSNSTQNITVTVPHGHRWGRLTITDSNGVSQWMVFQIFVDDPTIPTLALVAADRLSLTRNLTGHHCTFTAYKNVKTSDLIDGTRMIVVSKPRYSLGDPDIDSVRFVGYLTKESNNTNGPNDKSVSFEMAGLWERAGQLPFNAIAIRHKTSPSAWDEMAYPTTQRVVWHILARYSVLPNLAALDFDVTDNTWFGGDRNVSSNSLGDACESALSEINATLMGDPSGQMRLRRWAYYLTTAQKNALDSVLTLGASDIRNLNFSRTHDEPVGGAVIGWAGYFTDGSTPKIGRARAPVVTLGTSPEVREINNQLLQADQTETALLTEAADRAANQLGVANLAYTLSCEGRDGFDWLTPSVQQWVPVALATGLTTRGRTMSNVRHLLVGMQIDYDNRANTHTNKFELQPEPGPQSALVVANLTPSAQALDEIVSPIGSAFPGLNSPSSLNSPDTTTPPLFTPNNTGGIGSVWPADRQADQATRTPANGSRVIPIGLWVATAVNAGFLSVDGADYTYSVSGSGKIADDAWTQTFDFTSSDGGWTVYDGGVYVPGVGWQTTLYNQDPGGPGQAIYRLIAIQRAFDLGTITGFRAEGTVTFGVNDSVLEGRGAGLFDISELPATRLAATVYPASLPLQWGGQVETDKLFFSVVSGYDDIGTLPDPGGQATLKKIIARGTGINPFTGVLGTGKIYADALFIWELDADGNEINVRLNPDLGLKIDGTVATTLLYNKSHEYTFTRTGTGSQFALLFNDSNYEDNQRVPLLVTIAGPNAGT